MTDGNDKIDFTGGAGSIQIRHSETLGKLAEALAAAHCEFEAVTKDRTARIESQKGSYSYSYADLASVLDAVRKHLGKHGLALVQPMAWSAGHPWLITRLIHSSGEWLESVYPIATYERPQEMGSAITYARRYALTALVGIAPEDDDDGQAATQSRGPRPAPSSPAAPTPRPSGQKQECPGCGADASPSKYPKPGAGYHCMACGVNFDTKPSPPAA